ncbi:hypothetical protein ACJW31_01G111900 [Castanea mollissima]
MQVLFPIFLLLLPLLFFFFLNSNSKSKSKVPKSYPLVGSLFAIFANRKRLLPWLSDILQDSPSATIVLHCSYAAYQVFSANPAVFQHILKTNFPNYQKFQRQVSSHEFNTKSLCKFVDTELSNRLIPILSSAAKHGTIVLDTAFEFDLAYLSPSLPQAKFTLAFEEGVRYSSERFNVLLLFIWEIKKLLNIGLEKWLRIVVSEIQEFAMNKINEKKQELGEKQSLDSVDLLSRFLSSGHSDEHFVIDIAALKYMKKSEATIYDMVKDMVYCRHTSLCESMRLYPPVLTDTKEVVNDDIFPSGTVVKKGIKVSYKVSYFPYAMGRLETLWGSEWAEFKPERWLQKEEENSSLKSSSSWKFVGRDSYKYPIFQAGPRICLGKDMTFLQMKRVVVVVLRRFKVKPAFKQGVHHEPE